MITTLTSFYFAKNVSVTPCDVEIFHLGMTLKDAHKALFQAILDEKILWIGETFAKNMAFQIGTKKNIIVALNDDYSVDHVNVDDYTSVCVSTITTPVDKKGVTQDPVFTNIFGLFLAVFTDCGDYNDPRLSKVYDKKLSASKISSLNKHIKVIKLG